MMKMVTTTSFTCIILAAMVTAQTPAPTTRWYPRITPGHQTETPRPTPNPWTGPTVRGSAPPVIGSNPPNNYWTSRGPLAATTKPWPVDGAAATPAMESETAGTTWNPDFEVRKDQALEGLSAFMDFAKDEVEQVEKEFKTRVDSMTGYFAYRNNKNGGAINDAVHQLIAAIRA